MEVEARLRAFAAVARWGSFTRAAGELHISQPAVSKHVSALEAEVGLPLLVRDARGATPTEAGRIIADYVFRAEALLVQATRNAQALRRADAGTLLLAASTTPGTYLLPAVVAAFTEEHPAVTVSFRIGTWAEVTEMVRSHTIEIGVVGGASSGPDIESEPLVEDAIVVVGPPALSGKRLTRRELERLTWIHREEGSATRAALEAAWREAGIDPRRRLELPSWEAVKIAVATGAGIAACSRFALDVELSAGVLAVLRVPQWRLRRTISVVHARGVPKSPPAERFLALLKAAWRKPSRVR